MEARCRASIQLLLVQGSGELWAAHGQQLEQRSVVILLDMLARMGGHARAINAYGALRRDLAVAQASDQVPAPPPPPPPSWERCHCCKHGRRAATPIAQGA